MPTYEYECRACGNRFDQHQQMSDAAVTACPSCGGDVRRLISGGSGFILKNSGSYPMPYKSGGCALEQTGRTCCGRDDKCGDAHCKG